MYILHTIIFVVAVFVLVVRFVVIAVAIVAVGVFVAVCAALYIFAVTDVLFCFVDVVVLTRQAGTYQES